MVTYRGKEANTTSVATPTTGRSGKVGPKASCGHDKKRGALARVVPVQVGQAWQGVVGGWVASTAHQRNISQHEEKARGAADNTGE